MKIQFSPRRIAKLLGRKHNPSAQQERIITADLEPTLVVAGAGSGKTETMSDRVLYLLVNGIVTPEQVLGLTFTRKAAGELSERIARRLQRLLHNSEIYRELPPALQEASTLSYRRPHISTYNAFAAQIVADHSLLVGVEPDTQVASGATLWQLASQVVSKQIEYTELFDSSFNTIVSALVNLAQKLNDNLAEPEQVQQGMRAWRETVKHLPGKIIQIDQKILDRLRDREVIVGFIHEFQALKKQHELMDFSDQVAMAVQLAQGHDNIRSQYSSQYRVVLLDEYQDTSAAQLKLLHGLFGQGKSRGVMAVGDPHQAIYGWRGASSSSLSQYVTAFGVPKQRQLGLNTSWRNAQDILTLANHISGPLRSGPIDVQRLLPRQGAGTGHIEITYETNEQVELETMVEFFQEHWQEGRTSAAVLCRKRSQFDAIEAALSAAGFPVEVVGLAGLLHTPEITELLSCLYAAFNPARADQAMRLLTGNRFRVGLADISALHEYARESSRKHGKRGLKNADDQVQEDVTIVDALAMLPSSYDRVQNTATLTGLSEAGFVRLHAVHQLLDDIRKHAHLPLAELLHYTIRRMYLDVEVAARDGVMARLGARRLTHFVQSAKQYASVTTYPTITGFLTWLEIAQRHERGLEDVSTSENPEAIQILTIHAAKGLEWDIVAVPGQMAKSFPGVTIKDGTSTNSGWLTDLEELPYFLRQDAADLPKFSLSGLEDMAEFKDRREEFKRTCGQYQLDEDRRLAYVAITRAKTHLWLSASAYRSETKTRQEPGLFLLEAAGRDGELHVSAELAAQQRQWLCTWIPEDDIEETNPLLSSRQEQWPVASISETAKDFGERVSGYLRSGEVTVSQEFVDLVSALVRIEQPSVRSSELPTMTSASALVALAADPERWHRNRLRPIPEQPYEQSNLGTAFHTWVENYFQHSSLISEDDISAAKRVADPKKLQQLQETFLASPWAQLEPVALEQECQLVVDGRVIINRIDAVYRDPQADNPESYLVIDWKTGRQPHTSEQMRTREIQLLCYQLAWANYKNIDPARVRAAFFYVADNHMVTTKTAPNLEHLSTLLASHERYELPQARTTQ